MDDRKSFPNRGGASGGDDSDERKLIAGLRSRDPQAFDRLVRGYGGMMLAVARRITQNDEDARECVQESCLAVFRSVDSFEERSRLGPWLRRIVANSALMRLRARRSRPEDSIDPQGPTYDEFAFREGPRRANAYTPEELAERKESRELVHSAMESLPESYRVVLRLRDIEGFSTAETAELVNASEAAVKTRLHRARTNLKELLQPLFQEDLQ